MRRGYSILILAACFATESIRAQVVIEGTVQLPKPSFDRGLNQRYGASNDVPIAPTNPPAAVVYLEGDFHSQPNTNSKSPAQMAQKNIAFAPDLLPVLIGTAVDFPNMDDTYHNVFSYSKTKRFDLGRFRKDEKPTTVVFDKPGVVTIHCEIHERMRGTILVLETPHFQKTDTAGRYRLEHPPRRELPAESLGGWRRCPATARGTESRHDLACRFSSQVTKPITFNYNLTAALSFRAKLLLAMMLIVLAVTIGTVYFAEENRRTNQERALDAQFQNQVQSFLKIQESQSEAITEKCRALSRGVRIRAALEERDVDDMYRNALTELEGILEHPNASTDSPSDVGRASFFRFLDAEGQVLPPEGHPAGLTDQPSLHEALSAMGKVLRDADEQAVGYIALARGNQPADLREIVLTKIRDPSGRSLGTLVVGFPIGHLQDSENGSADSIESGIWLNQRLYMENLGAVDRRLVAEQISAASSRETASRFRVDLENGPYLLYYKALDSGTQFAPAYQVCLYPLAVTIREEEALRWKIVAFGLIVLSLGFAASLFIAKRLSKPVEEIVAGSVENLTRREQAETDLRETNRELEKALRELKATQQQVIQQERLSAIGQMASGIAHDFNNTLTPILGFTELLLESETLLDDKVEARRCLEMLRTSTKDAANVVSRLREFYRPADTDEEFPIVDLAKIVQQAVLLTEPKWRSQTQAMGVTVEVTAEIKASPFVAGEESALREVLTNLIFNAVDAMPEGGRIALETAIDGTDAIIHVRDSGTGMSESVRQRCLEPFFSTKGALGTGLGLSMVYGIIERHRGRLEIESAVGEGTTFTIRLPLAEDSTASVPEIADEARPISSLKILIVDDEPNILEVVSSYLRCDGHSVATAASGREALEKFRRNHFDLVVLDRVMPEMSGDQTARFIKQLNQDIPVIMLTGFGALIEVTGSQPQAVDVVLSKPVTIDALRTTIGRLLHAA